MTISQLYVFVQPLLNGRFIEQIDLDISPKLKEDDIIKIVLDTLKAEKYAWEDDKVCNSIKEYQETCLPIVTLFITNAFNCFAPNFEVKNFKLYYQVDLITGGLDPIKYTLIVDANSGVVNFFDDNSKR